MTTTTSMKIPDSGRAQRLNVVAGACSLQGPRRETNEDSQYVSPDLDLFIVADGMGGHAAGEVASKFAVDVLSHELAKIGVDAPPKEIEDRVRGALDRANCLILDMAASNPNYEGAGTTVVMALLSNHRLYVSGVGDSRAYLIRNGSIQRLTIDDTWPDALVHLGQLSVDEARRHHLRNMLLCSMGMQEFDARREEIRALDVYHGDRYLLASDGLTDSIEEARLLEIISHTDDPQRAAQRLTQEAIASGAGDDITCVLFYVQADLARKPPASLAALRRLISVFARTRRRPPPS